MRRSGPKSARRGADTVRQHPEGRDAESIPVLRAVCVRARARVCVCMCVCVQLLSLRI